MDLSTWRREGARYRRLYRSPLHFSVFGQQIDALLVWNCSNFYFSLAIASALDGCLHSSGLRKEDIGLFDLYSLVARCVEQTLKLAADYPNRFLLVDASRSFLN